MHSKYFVILMISSLCFNLQWVGSKCGQHGPYTFFKGFKFLKNSKWRTISLGEFFFVKCSENDPLCIAELQLLWEDKGTEGIMLSSLRLYFLPEHTPDGRHHSHGEVSYYFSSYVSKMIFPKIRMK